LEKRAEMVGGASLDSLGVKEVVGKFPQEMSRMVETSPMEKRAKMVGGVPFNPIFNKLRLN